VLRSIGDVGDYSIRVESGRHPEFVKPSDDLGRAVADILLKKGVDSNIEFFPRSLWAAVRLANSWGSRLYNMRLLRDLLVEPEPVRKAACSALVELFYEQYECLSGIRDDPEEPDSNKDYARYMLEREEQRRAGLIQQLRDPADLRFTKMEEPDSREGIFEELQGLLFSPNIDVRKSACTALKRYYPHEKTQCPL
jgi:hypothetical protein